jgi:hypothetical protein
MPSNLNEITVYVHEFGFWTEASGRKVVLADGGKEGLRPNS